jgi:uncharacterized protein (TIGR04141 family)
MKLRLSGLLLLPDVSPLSVLTASAAPVASHYEWSKGSLRPLEQVNAEDLEAAEVGDILLSIVDRPTPLPDWQQFIRDAFSVPEFLPFGARSRGALVFCAVEDPKVGKLRWVTWSFGTGANSLRRERLEPRFGLLAAFNRIVEDADPRDAGGPGLRQLQYETFGSFRQRTGHRAAHDTPLDGFRMDRLVDLLSAVGGRTGGEDSVQVFGRRQIQFSQDVDAPEDLAELARAAVMDFRLDAYKRDYAFIDDHVLVEDPTIRRRIRQAAFDLLVRSDEAIDVFMPDDLLDFDDDRTLQYVLLHEERKSSASSMILTVDRLALLAETSSPEMLDWDLRFCDQPDNVIAHARILDCLTAEVRLSDGRYLLAEGSFFAVSSGYLDRVNAELKDIAIWDHELPCYGGGAEGPWNRNVPQVLGDEYICLDTALVRLEGETPFEAADLVHLSGALLHVKRKSRSSTLGHLFAQAKRSAEFLTQIPEAVDQTLGYIKASSGSARVRQSAAQRIGQLRSGRSPGIPVVLVILGDWKGRGLVNLPLLAKAELLATVRRVNLLGYETQVALVDSCARSA